MSTRLVSRTDRLAAIEQMLFRSNLGLRVVEIAEHCGVDRRTIYRDLSLLSDIGLPIHQKDGRFFLNREQYQATLRLNVDETISLALAVRAVTRSQPAAPHLLRALEKLTHALPLPIAEHIRMLSAIAISPLDTQAAQVVETVARAWGERRKVRLWNEGEQNTRRASRDFAPYFMDFDTQHGTTVIGYDSLTQRVHALALARIQRARVLPEPYYVPAQFDPRPFLNRFIETPEEIFP